MSGVVAGEGAKAKSGIPVLHAGSHFRHGLLQLMIHTIDPLHDGKNKKKIRIAQYTVWKLKNFTAKQRFCISEFLPI